MKNATYEKSITSNNDKLHIQQSKEPIIHNMTKDKLLEQANREVLYEEMDWEPMKDEEITLEVLLLQLNYYINKLRVTNKIKMYIR